ncbi:MAG: 50S ribosomal protein L30 [Euryarchaeota archaeon]|nr:50S ribosomal protein L30 [Euryarchaeota archaeon]
MSGILVVRLRSDIHVRTDMSDTMKLLNLTRVNHATIIPDNDVNRGMIQKIKDWVTYGPVSKETAARLVAERAETQGGGRVTDAILADNSDFKSVDEFAAALAEGRAKLGIRKLVEGSKTRKTWVVKPVLRLNPPKKGHEGIKHSFRSGGALGDRGDAIAGLVERMV